MVAVAVVVSFGLQMVEQDRAYDFRVIDVHLAAICLDKYGCRVVLPATIASELTCRLVAKISCLAKYNRGCNV